MGSGATHSTRWRAPGLALVIALGLHAGLLWWLAQWDSASPPDPRPALQLHWGGPRPPEAPAHHPPPAPAPAEPVAAAGPAPAPRPAPAKPVARPSPKPALSTRGLRAAAARIVREPMDPGAPVIARATASDLVDAWSRPLLSRPANRFDGSVLPRRTEVVDRWRDPAGVQQVVIRTATGLTLCGRQGEVDPTRPWLQMPMMFRECAGGGQRAASFTAN